MSELTRRDDFAIEDAFVERVTEEGLVYFRLPSGLREVLRVPLDQVPRYRRLAPHDERPRADAPPPRARGRRFPPLRIAHPPPIAEVGYNPTSKMEIRGISKRDFDTIVREIDKWWGGPVANLAHPVFFYEFGDSALVAEDGGEIVGFLFGFVAPTAPPVGYVHLVGVRPDWRNRKLGQQLYERFMATCRARGVRKLRAIAAVADERSKKFHERLGFVAVEDADYAGSGRARVVFTRDLE